MHYKLDRKLVGRGLLYGTWLALMGVSSASADSVTVSVAGTSNPYLAGMPNGSTAAFSDSAPAESPVLLNATLVPGASITFTNVTGGVSFQGGTPTDGPDGSGFLQHIDQAPGTTPTNPENGISDMVGPLDSLVGVFLDDNRPDLSAAPIALNFGSALNDPNFTDVADGTGFASLAPSLKQLFFIGDGLTGTGSGATQTFIVPTGATRLYLGTLDGFDWNGDTGQITVTVNNVTGNATPLPMSVYGGAALLGSLFFARRKTVARA